MTTRGTISTMHGIWLVLPFGAWLISSLLGVMPLSLTNFGNGVQSCTSIGLGQRRISRLASQGSFSSVVATMLSTLSSCRLHLGGLSGQ